MNNRKHGRLRRHQTMRRLLKELLRIGGQTDENGNRWTEPHTDGDEYVCVWRRQNRGPIIISRLVKGSDTPFHKAY